MKYTTQLLKISAKLEKALNIKGEIVEGTNGVQWLYLQSDDFNIYSAICSMLWKIKNIRTETHYNTHSVRVYIKQDYDRWQKWNCERQALSDQFWLVMRDEGREAADKFVIDNFESYKKYGFYD